MDWSKFERRIFINADVKQVYDAWTIPELVETWFLEKADYFNLDGTPIPKTDNVTKGCKYTWKWNNWDQFQDGVIYEANGKDHIRFDFGKGGMVNVNISKCERGVELVLTQENIPLDETSKMNMYVGCSNGWSFWMINLKAWLEHNILLNEKGLKTGETKNLVNS